MHHLWRLVLGGRLYSAPIVESQVERVRASISSLYVESINE